MSAICCASSSSTPPPAPSSPIGSRGPSASSPSSAPTIRRHLDDEPLKALVAELLAGSAVFARFWEEHAVIGREGGRRGFNHPVDGLVEARQVTLSPIGRPDLKLVMLIPGEPQRGAEAPAGTAPSIAPGPRHG